MGMLRCILGSPYPVFSVGGFYTEPTSKGIRAYLATSICPLSTGKSCAS